MFFKLKYKFTEYFRGKIVLFRQISRVNFQKKRSLMTAEARIFHLINRFKSNQKYH